MTAGFDIAVIGGGIVGLAAAEALSRAGTSHSIVVLEKEPEVATHQSGRNSGVIHSGLYYEPGSLKAHLCVEGARRLFDFCAEHDIATTRTGKIVIATKRGQIPSLDGLERRAAANGVGAERIGPEGIIEHEPHARGIEGLWVPSTGAVDFGDVARTLARLLTSAGHAIRTDFEVRGGRRTGDVWHLVGDEGEVPARVLVNCAGLHVDHVMRRLGQKPDLQVLPFRGEYWRLGEEAAGRVRGHIYPVPDPRLPHLGAHFTRSPSGRVELGPNAVWAWGREAYGRVSGHPSDALETLGSRGFWKLARAHWRSGLAEQWRSLDKRAMVRLARSMMPQLAAGDLTSWRSGIRAQAVTKDGALVHDFVIREGPGIVHLLNAPSPAATACLPIGERIAARALRLLGLRAT